MFLTSTPIARKSPRARSSSPAAPPFATTPWIESWLEHLARGLHRFGTPAHRLEEALEEAARRRGIETQVFSTPTAIFLALGQSGVQQTRLMRLEPGEVNLEKLCQLDDELDRAATANIRGVAADQADLRDAISRIDHLVRAPNRYGAFATTVAFSLAAGSSARFFGGSPREVAAAAGIGLLIGLLALATQLVPRSRRLFEPAAAMAAALAATSMATAVDGLSPLIMTLSGLIVLIPGLTLTTAMTELATGHLVSGGARLAGALLTFLTIGFGVAVGSRVGTLLVGAAASVSAVPQPTWTEGVALVVAALSFVVLFRARPADGGWILAAATLAYFGARTGATVLGPELGALFGALALGIGSNLHARWWQRPAALTQVPGLMLLVPGSIGFRSVAALMENDTLSGVQTAFTMILVAIALVTGLLIANVLVPTRRAL